MSTRKLILTALVCGLAILVAGGIQLFRLKGSDPVELPGLGESRVVAGVTVRPDTVETAGDTTLVTVLVSATGDAVGASAGSGWTLLRKTTFTPTGSSGDVPSCSEVRLAADAQRCRLAFDAPGDDARFLAYERGNARAQWALDS